MMKKIIPIIFFILMVSLMGIVKAEDDMVYVLNLHYENDKITLTDSVLKYGYSPDYKIPYGDYSLYVLDDAENILYSFSFAVPLTVYTDVVVDQNTVGEVIKLDKTDFSLTIPFFAKAKELRIYDKDNAFIFSEDIYSEGSNHIILFSVIGSVVVIILLYYFRRRAKQ